MVVGKTAKRFRFILGVLVLVFTVAYIFPVYWVAATSLKTRVQAFQMPPAWLFQPTSANYQSILSQVDVPRSYVNSLVVALASTSISILFGSMAAYGLVRMRIRRREDLSFWILSTRMFPPIASIIPIYMLFRNINMLDTRVALVLVYTTFNLGFTVWMMEGFFSEIPLELEQCAFIDGCTRWQVLARIVFPLARPGLAATAIFCLIFSWNEYLFAVILTGRNSRTMPVIVASAITDRGVQWGDLTAVAVLVGVPVMVFASLVQKQMVRGLTFGALKQ